MSEAPVIAVTGGVGCGKSEVGRILSEIGVSVLDTDQAVHRLLSEDAAVHAAVVARFGQEILSDNGAIDRRRLAERVFPNEEARRALEAILHPRVRVMAEAWRQQARSSHGGAALVPLLFEAGFDQGWDEIWCVVAREEIADARLRQRGWSLERIREVRKAQWPLERKAERAHVVIENNSTREELKALVLDHWRRLERRSMQYAG